MTTLHQEPAGGGELAGIPFAVKDNIDVAGTPTTAGSPLLAGAVAEVDAGVVSALRAAGAVVAGKTNMHELALGITSNNTAYGPVRNPHDPERVAGGSSGGSAATVALGTVPFSLGTDTGASVTLPASFCGVVGFRPSTGRYPGDGVVMISTTRDTVGLHARTVADVRRVDRVITSSRPAADRPGLAGVRLGVLRGRFHDIDPRAGAVLSAALDTLAEAGAELVDLDLTDDLALAGEAGLPIVLFETLRLLRARTTKSFDAVASPDVKGIMQIMVDEPVSPADYERHRAQRWRLRQAYAGLFESSGADALIAPTTHVLPPRVGEDVTFEHNGHHVPTFATSIRNAAPGTVSGVPMLSLPAGRTEDGLPVGLTLEGPVFEDPALLAVAEAVEKALGRGL
ncbi:mandelamide amidase [Paractinoplanes atraurantiacus]|uniref:Mandelamide amidase n=1 Tax=Paractinoplanes atraurantiacus TaxID=1036182 RepID=A0A285JVV6_9ACTN|nr:mandelamide amidase [Actinoplanes atraurantiacus]